MLLDYEYLKRFFFLKKKSVSYRLNIKYLGVVKISKRERTDVGSALDWSVIIFFINDCMLRKKSSSIKYVLHVKGQSVKHN